MKPPLFQCKTTSSCSLFALVKCPSPSLLQASFSYWEAAQRFPRAFSSPARTITTLLAGLHQRDASAFWSFLQLSYRPSWAAMSFLAGSPRAGCSALGGVSPEWSRRVESAPMTCWPWCFWCSPGYSLLSGLPVHIPGYNSVLNAPPPSSPSLPGCSPSSHCPACIHTWDCPNLGAGPCTWLCWISWGLYIIQWELTKLPWLQPDEQLLLSCKHTSEAKGLTFLIVYIILILLPSLWCI